MNRNELVEMLERRGVVTTDPDRADECCGLPRDEDGFCTYREGHPIYVERRALADCADEAAAGSDLGPARQCSCDRHRGDHSKCYAGCDLSGCRSLR